MESTPESELSRSSQSSFSEDISVVDASSSNAEPDANEEIRTQRKRKRSSIDLFEIFGDDANNEHSRNSIEARVSDEIANYQFVKVQRVDDHIDFDVLDWWRKNQLQFPILTNFAKFIHSIPASSAPAERSFSTAGHVISDKRNCLKPETLNASLFLRSNWDLLS